MHKRHRLNVSRLIVLSAWPAAGACSRNLAARAKDGAIGGRATRVGTGGSTAASNTVWFAPSGTTSFLAGATMTQAAGTATSIAVPANIGTYKACVINSQGSKVGESAALLRVQ